MTHLRRWLTPLVAVLVCAMVFVFTVQPAASSADTAALTGRFAFTAYPVNAADTPGERRIRTVAPAYRHIDAWISSVGAAVALFSLDGGPVAHDLCVVDPRTDTVTVEPAPTTGRRYQPFTLVPHGLPMPSSAAPMGCLPADLNDDGWQDVVVYYWGRSPVLFLRTPGTAPSASAFTAREVVTPWQVWNTNAATVADLDSDGRLDLVFGNYFPDGARILDPTAGPDGLVMADSLSHAANGGRLHVLRNTSKGPTFTDVSDAVPTDARTGWTLAIAAQDIGGGGRPDLYVGEDFGPDHLLVNESTPGHVAFGEARGVRHATTPKSKALGRGSFKGMGVAFADLTDAGVPSILVSNITEPYALEESNFTFLPIAGRSTIDTALRAGTALYDDHSEELGLSRSGWSWDVKAADFANDGTDEVLQATGFVAGTVNRWPQLQETAMSNDLVLSHPELWPDLTAGTDLSGHDHNTFFVRDPAGRYVNVADQIGVGEGVPSRAIAIGDVTGDGRLDFVVARQWAQSTLYRNESPAGEFVGVRPRQPAESGGCVVRTAGPSTPAIGTEALATLPDGRTQLQELYPANGHNGVNAPELLFGLGHQPVHTVPIRLTWRDACGRGHAAALSLAPGWHQLLLEPDGSVVEVR
ncbi:MAG TPA: VCBS repeat-containing protein [Pseudonocardiaceae bacterium]|nr:VCBS repeat-containing protein [Pseudonocardiaceae bacterium]